MREISAGKRRSRPSRSNMVAAAPGDHPPMPPGFSIGDRSPFLSSFPFLSYLTPGAFALVSCPHALFIPTWPPRPPSLFTRLLHVDPNAPHATL